MGWLLAFILFSIMIIALAVVVYRNRQSQISRYLTAEDKAFVHVRWHEIEARLKKGGPTNLRQAVLDADLLLDHCLQQLQVSGETMGERLRAASDRFANPNAVWSAHKVRNQIVHEVDKKLLSFEAKQAVARFKQGLHDLGAL